MHTSTLFIEAESAGRFSTGRGDLLHIGVILAALPHLGWEVDLAWDEVEEALRHNLGLPPAPRVPEGNNIFLKDNIKRQHNT